MIRTVVDKEPRVVAFKKQPQSQESRESSSDNECSHLQTLKKALHKKLLVYKITNEQYI